MFIYYGVFGEAPHLFALLIHAPILYLHTSWLCSRLFFWFNKTTFCIIIPCVASICVASFKPGGNNTAQHTEQCDKAPYRHYTYMRHRWRDGEMEVSVTGRIWGWAETPNVRVTGDKDKLVRLLEAPSLHRCTHLTSCWQIHDGAVQAGKKKNRTTVIFTFFCSPHPSLHPSFCSSLAISRWVHSLVLSNFRKKSSAVTQSISAAFCPELMKSHAYWKRLCALPWRWRDHHEDLPLFQSINQSVVASLGLEKNSLFHSAPYGVIDCNVEALIYLSNNILLPGHVR